MSENNPVGILEKIKARFREKIDTEQPKMAAKFEKAGIVPFSKLSNKEKSFRTLICIPLGLIFLLIPNYGFILFLLFVILMSFQAIFYYFK